MPYVDNDYYAVLQVNSSASIEEIRNAFRRMILRHHPDLNAGHPTAAESTILIYEAYETLSDPLRRADYDASPFREDGKAGEQPKQRSRIWTRALSEPEPIECCRCGQCDDTLRLSAFPVVTGLIWRTDHVHRDEGVYCSLCRFLLATRWSVYCTLFGWWSPTGPYWTLRALPRNMLGALARPSAQKAVLLMLARRLIRLQKLHDAARVIRRLAKIDPEDPAIPEMLAEIALLRGDRTMRPRPVLSARRLPPPAVSYLTIAVPIWLTIHYYPAVLRTIAPQQPHRAKALPAPEAASAALTDPAQPAGDATSRWEFDGAPSGGMIPLAPATQSGFGAKGDPLSADAQMSDGNATPSDRTLDHDGTDGTPEILGPGSSPILIGSGVRSLNRSSQYDSTDNADAVWGDIRKYNRQSAVPDRWSYEVPTPTNSSWSDIGQFNEQPDMSIQYDASTPLKPVSSDIDSYDLQTGLVDETPTYSADSDQ